MSKVGRQLVLIAAFDEDADDGEAIVELFRSGTLTDGQERLAIHRAELLHTPQQAASAARMTREIARLSPETTVHSHLLDYQDASTFAPIYTALHTFSATYPFTPDTSDYLVFTAPHASMLHLSLCLLASSGHIPARLIQIGPRVASADAAQSTTMSDDVDGRRGDGRRRVSIVDLDVSHYHRLPAGAAQDAGRRTRDDAEEDAQINDGDEARRERHERLSMLKSGIETRDATFNRLVERIEQVALTSRTPLLLLGPPGSGKSRLARRIFDLKRARHHLTGDFVELSCGTVRGDAAMSALFGHRRGAFTGAVQDRAGLVRAADGGVLFLDEIGELGPHEQAMLLRALEHGTFRPLGADQEASSDFQLIAGTNRDLGQAARHGRFREDLLARINVWTFHLPGLAARPEDLAPNLESELAAFARTHAIPVSFNKDARERFMSFATAPLASWPGNFRDFNASITRMATLAPAARITLDIVDAEIAHLRRAWARQDDHTDSLVTLALGPERSTELDRFDRVQLEDVLRLCRERRTLSDAGRALFSISRTTKRSTNDADRLRKYLARFGLEWQTLRVLLDRHV
jgi:transcriptional regulatory protein RtcR